MGCCGGGNKRIRKQVLNRPEKAPKQAAVHRVKKRSTSAQPMRQRVRTSQKCESCGFPTMLVNIAGRERSQCTNTGCRKIVR
jgi:hypothetical protein